jgi:hemolysin D
MSKWYSLKRDKSAKGKTAIDYLPDADELERSPLPRYAQFTIHVAMIGLISAGIWATFSQMEKVVSAQGSLVNPLPNIVVQPLETGVIQSVAVKMGQIVKKGDTLATLDATFSQADENQLRLRLNSLETQVKGLSLEMSGGTSMTQAPVNADDQLQASLLSERKANYNAQEQKMGETAAKLRAALATNRHDQKLVASRLRSFKEIESMQEKLVAQKYGAPLQLMEAQLRSKEVERELELVANREQEILREMAAFESERTAFRKAWRQKTLEELLVITRERDGLKEQLGKADRRSKLVTLTAPVDAVVLDIAKLSPGSIVREAETFFTLVPLNVTLEAEVRVDSQDIGYIKTGHEVRIKLDTFPYQRHGTLDAKVRTISEDAFQPDAASKSGAGVYYRARLKLDNTNLKNMLESARLLPGMTLTAEIVVGKRSVISYLAWPLTKGLQESAREP